MVPLCRASFSSSHMLVLSSYQMISADIQQEPDNNSSFILFELLDMWRERSGSRFITDQLILLIKLMLTSRMQTLCLMLSVCPVQLLFATALSSGVFMMI